MNSETSFIKGRFKSIGYALKGAWLLLRTEHSIMVQVFVAIVVTVAGFVCDISATEWMLQLLAIGLIFAAESANSAIEKLCDFVHPGHHSNIGFIKDISAGGVAFAAIFGIAVGCIIYIPRFL